MEAKDKLKKLLEQEISECRDRFKDPNNSIDSYRCYWEGRYDLAQSLLDRQIADSKPEIFIAKSGRKYRHVPVDMDIETWDAMTPVQRLEYKGLLRNAPVFDDSKVSEIEYCVQSFIRSQHLTKQWDEFRDAWFEADSKEIPTGAEEMYPKEFVLWFRDEALLPIDTNEKSGFIVMALRDDSSSEPSKIFTLQELFQYWQSNNLKNE